MTGLAPAELGLLEAARRATLATIAPDGRPRLVPVCYAVLPGGGDESSAAALWIPLDAKPKAVADVRLLARVRDIARDPRVTILVDRWSEDWDALGWVRLEGEAVLVEPPTEAEVASELLRRYPQYADHDLGRRPALRCVVQRVTSWTGSRDG